MTMESQLTYKEWQVHTLRDTDETMALMEAVLRQDNRHILKDDHNSLVYRITHAGEEVVVKSPTARNRRTSERIRTWVRAGKAMRMWRSMQVLQELGIDVPEPILTAHRRQWGMITDSFLVYRYVTGTPITDEDIPTVDDLLTRLHAAGYLRHDASPHNYLKSGERIVFVDTTLHRPILFKKSQRLLEHLAFHRQHPERWLAYHEHTAPNWHLRALLAYRQTTDTIRTWRRRLKKSHHPTDPNR